MAERSGKPQVHIRLRRHEGQWYAHARGGPKKPRNLSLCIAIAFCRRLNAKAKGGTHA